MTSEKVRVRFAPSPTGYLHIGGVRTALYNWLFARHEGGEFFLRIEDTDRTRSTDESIRVILDGLTWLGLNWDGEVIRQTDRLDNYRQAAQKLIEMGMAYRCYCTAEEMESMREAQLARKEKPRYDGRCRTRTDFPPDKPFCIRFKVPEGAAIQFEDLVYGSIQVGREELDDLVIIKTDGFASYNFANVIDDSDMGITHVIRGDDHVNNTPRQIVMYQALGLPLPRFAHLPMILDENRKRLSKRHGAANVLAYREEGVLPEALLNYLAKLGWGFGDQEFFTLNELVEKFTLDRVNKSACAIDPDKFRWLCGKHMENASNDRLGRLWLERLVSEGILDATQAEGLRDTPWLDKAVSSIKIRSKSISEMVVSGRFYFQPPENYEEKGAKKFLKPEILPALEELKDRLSALNEPFSELELEAVFKELVEKYSLGMLKLAQPVRLFLTGVTASPGIFEVLSLLGKEESLRRMERGLNTLRG